MMCAHSTPLPADAPAVQHAPDNVLDGGPPLLTAIVVCVGPLWDRLLVIAAFVYIYLTEIRKIKYNQLMGGAGVIPANRPNPRPPAGGS